MSNPYAVNGASTSSTRPYATNPYAANTASRPNPYSASNSNGSSTNVSSYNTRTSRDNPTASAPSSSNPYARAPPPRRTFGGQPQNEDSQDTANGLRSTSNLYTQPQEASRNGGGYGGLGAPSQDPPERNISPRPRTSGQDESRPTNGLQSQTRNGRAASDVRAMGPPPPRAPNHYAPLTENNGLRPTHNGGYNTERQYSSSPNRSLKSMDEIVQHIQNRWKIMEGDECVPVKVALQLADTSSLGLGDREEDFATTHVDLQKSLKAVVNEHYADFNSAVGTYHKIQSSIRESQNRVRYLKTGLINVKGGMLTTRPELRGLAEQSRELDELLLTLSQIEHLREMPARLEEKINEKRWIGAVDILGDALMSSQKSGFENIGAMTDTRNYFVSQEGSLVDMLIEELHDHLYLKSPYCSERWKGRKINRNKDESSQDSFGGNAWNRPVYHFLSNLDPKKPFVEEVSKNPESDTFQYIQTIIEALNKRGYLEELIHRIEQRLPVELNRVVEKTNLEIAAQHAPQLRSARTATRTSIQALQPDKESQAVLSDFLYTLYAKFEAIAEGHRVLHEVVLGIVERENLPKAEKLGISFRELWKLYQMEMRQLLHDYLATDGDLSTAGGRNLSSTNDVFLRQPRDKHKRIFRQADNEKDGEIKTHQDDLGGILKNSVPGLATKSKIISDTQMFSDRNGSGNTSAGGALLIEPSVFNMTILLGPSLAFLQHLKDIVPQTSQIPVSTLSSFLDDFLINVFHPQLEETIENLCAEAMMEFEAFSEDPRWAQYSPHPIFRGTVNFRNLVQVFANMLSSIPRDQMFTQLVISQLLKYYDTCFRFYKDLVSRTSRVDGSGTVSTVWKAGAGHAQEGELRDTVLKLWTEKGLSQSQRSDLFREEVKLLLASSKVNPIQSYDIISEPKSVHQLSLLYNSMQWLSASLAHLRHVEASHSQAHGHSRNQSLTGQHNQRRWTLITNLKPQEGTSSTMNTSDTYLPLTQETSIPFDETLLSFRSLAQKALLTLHFDIRCGVIHQLGRSVNPDSPTTADPSNQSTSTTSPTAPQTTPPRDGTTLTTSTPYSIPSPPTSASPLILSLTTDLISFEANISSYLGTRERRFILAGLGRLADKYLIASAEKIGLMNKSGAEKLRIDSLVLQQVLRGLGLGNSAHSDHLHTSTSTSAATTIVKGATGLGIDGSTAPIPNSPMPGSTNNAEALAEAEDDHDALLPYTQKYCDLFLAGPAAIMSYAKSQKSAVPNNNNNNNNDNSKTNDGATVRPVFTYDELRTLLELVYSTRIRGFEEGDTRDREDSVKAKKGLNEDLLGLGEEMWDR